MSAKKKDTHAEDDEEEADSCDDEPKTVEKVGTSGKFYGNIFGAVIKQYICCYSDVAVLLYSYIVT